MQGIWCRFCKSMSIVIVGGHDRMIRKYKDICDNFKCKHKIFTHMKADLEGQIGNPDLLVLFTSTMSHKMLKTAVSAANKNNIRVVHSKTSSSSALTGILQEFCS